MLNSVCACHLLFDNASTGGAKGRNLGQQKVAEGKSSQGLSWGVMIVKYNIIGDDQDTLHSAGGQMTCFPGLKLQVAADQILLHCNSTPGHDKRYQVVFLT